MHMAKQLITFIICATFTLQLNAQTIIRITNGEWEPHLSSQSYEYGLSSHIVKEAFKLEGINVEWGFFPWKRAYEIAKDGEFWDASAIWWPTQQTKKDFLISDPVMKSSLVFFHLKTHDFHWESTDDLKDLTVGLTRGYGYGDALLNAQQKNIIYTETVTTDEQNFMKMLSGRIDIFPNDRVVGYTQLRNSLKSDAPLFTHHPKEFEVRTLNLIISKNSKNAHLFLSKFNAGLKKLRDSGQYNNMIKALEKGVYDKQDNKWHP